MPSRHWAITVNSTLSPPKIILIDWFAQNNNFNFNINYSSLLLLVSKSLYVCTRLFSRGSWSPHSRCISVSLFLKSITPPVLVVVCMSPPTINILFIYLVIRTPHSLIQCKCKYYKQNDNNKQLGDSHQQQILQMLRDSRGKERAIEGTPCQEFICLQLIIT